jgi:hypothetical protein
MDNEIYAEVKEVFEKISKIGRFGKSGSSTRLSHYLLALLKTNFSHWKALEA